MSTHNICFRAEIRKIFTRYPPLSRPICMYENKIILQAFLLLRFYLFVFIRTILFVIKFFISARSSATKPGRVCILTSASSLTC